MHSFIWSDRKSGCLPSGLISSIWAEVTVGAGSCVRIRIVIGGKQRDVGSLQVQVMSSLRDWKDRRSMGR